MSHRSSRLPYARLLIALSLCLASGGHWLALQSLAWAGMLVSYSQKTNLTQAVEMTFDGRHPCSLCKQIDQARQTEQDNKSATTIQKLDFKFLLLPELKLLVRSYQTQAWKRSTLKAAAFSQLPEVPPPKGTSLLSFPIG